MALLTRLYRKRFGDTLGVGKGTPEQREPKSPRRGNIPRGYISTHFYNILAFFELYSYWGFNFFFFLNIPRFLISIWLLGIWNLIGISKMFEIFTRNSPRVYLIFWPYRNSVGAICFLFSNPDVISTKIVTIAWHNGQSNFAQNRTARLKRRLVVAGTPSAGQGERGPSYHKRFGGPPYKKTIEIQYQKRIKVCTLRIGSHARITFGEPRESVTGRNDKNDRNTSISIQ